LRLGPDLDADSLCRLAEQAEAWGYGSFFLPETHFVEATPIPDPVLLVAAGDADTTAPEREMRIGFIERDGLKGIAARFTILRDCRAIWKTLVNYRNYAEIFEGNLRTPRVQEESDVGATVEFWVDAKLRNSNFVLRRSYDAYCRKIS
jgi:hypothetical protein